MVRSFLVTPLKSSYKVACVMQCNVCYSVCCSVYYGVCCSVLQCAAVMTHSFLVTSLNYSYNFAVCVLQCVLQCVL